MTWHTNLDTYERIIESDAKSSAIAIAACGLSTLAMRDEMLPEIQAADNAKAAVASPTPTPLAAAAATPRP